MTTPSFKVRVIPRASKTAITGTRGDAIVVRLAAPPVDGAANAALVEFIADLFGRPKRDVAIVSGLTSRHKRVTIAGLDQAELERRLSEILKGTR